MAQFENPGFLHKKDPDLFRSSEVNQAVHRRTVLKGESTSADALARIQAYLDRLSEILNRKDVWARDHGIEAIKRSLYINFVLKPEDIPNSYWDLQKRIAREQGLGEIEIDSEMKRQHEEMLIADQRSSLNFWIDSLTSDDAPYPDWLKYWAIKSVLTMGEYDKEKKVFPKRSKATTKPFPEFNQEALAYVLDRMEDKYDPDDTRSPRSFSFTYEEKSLLERESFAKLYAYAIEKIAIPTSKELLGITRGTWVKYEKGSDCTPLIKSLRGHCTGWCITGRVTAKNYLLMGDIHVFYSEDEQGSPTIPRAAIQVYKQKISQVRGIAAKQNLDSFISFVVTDKLKEFVDGEAFQEKSRDMNRLTHLERKMGLEYPLTREDLIFLYEIHLDIQGFGKEADPRIQELRGKRDVSEDIPIIFGCEPSQVAYTKEAINEQTIVYIGELFEGIFTEFRWLRHVYTKFPDKEIRKRSFETNENAYEVFSEACRSRAISVGYRGESMVKQIGLNDFTKSRSGEFVELAIADLFPDQDSHSAKELYEKARIAGLCLCDQATGPFLALHYEVNHTLFVAMEPITIVPSEMDDSYEDSDETDQATVANLNTYIFNLSRNIDNKVSLDGSQLETEGGFGPQDRFVFYVPA